MTATDLKFDCAGAARRIANYSIGLARLVSQVGVEDALPAGSGTLVTVGDVHGILTAAHVVQNLPNFGKVAVMLFPSNSSVLQKQTINMAHTEKLVIASGNNGPSGPDLGFLRLPVVNVKNLRATNSFLDIGKRHGGQLAAHKGNAYVDAVIGVVSEWTEELEPARPDTRLKRFQLLYCGGIVSSKYQVNGFDLCTFQPSFEPGRSPPTSTLAQRF